MRLEFISIEEFYFALTLAVRTLEEIQNPRLVDAVRSRLAEKLGEPSTIAAGNQNTFNYVFRTLDWDNSPNAQTIVSVSDWQDKLRLSSDYGWALNAERKPERTNKHGDRDRFCQQLKADLTAWLHIPPI